MCCLCQQVPLCAKDREKCEIGTGSLATSCPQRTEVYYPQQQGRDLSGCIYTNRQIHTHTYINTYLAHLHELCSVVPKWMHPFSSPPQYIYFWLWCSFRRSFKRRFSFCRFLGRGREEPELLLTRNFKWKHCIIEPCWPETLSGNPAYLSLVLVPVNST